MVYNINDEAFKLAEFSAQAMIYEVSCFPSPGLVSPVSNGAHTDMNYYTFVDSTCALIKYFTLIAEEGLKPCSCKELFDRIREIGMDGERDMFAKTNGVNTHKGMLFLLGIACAASGKAIFEKRSFREIQDIIKEMCKGLVERELDTVVDNGKLSYGEKLYIKYKIRGVRGEVEDGLPTVFNFALDFYDKAFELDANSRLVHTLIGIMELSEDTNIIHRHSYDMLKKVQQSAKDTISAGGMKTAAGRKMIENLCSEFINEHVSPGGSADLLGVTVFLHMVRKYMNRMC